MTYTPGRGLQLPKQYIPPAATEIKKGSKSSIPVQRQQVAVKRTGTKKYEAALAENGMSKCAKFRNHTKMCLVVWSFEFEKFCQTYPL